jgi:8-oxo-dGTP pyrophosphatase MutT (NUDIX family)
LTSGVPARTYTSAGGVVIDATGDRVLTLLRPKRLGPDGRPEVRLPKGHIEPGESRQQAALREVREEAGLSDLEILADLGHQTVEFNWKGHHYVRDESYYLMMLSPGAPPGQPEKQFEALWLTWEETLARLTFEAEREWVQRAQMAWASQREGQPGDSRQPDSDR